MHWVRAREYRLHVLLLAQLTFGLTDFWTSGLPDFRTSGPVYGSRVEVQHRARLPHCDLGSTIPAMPNAVRLCLLSASLLTVVACSRERNRWEPAPEPEATPVTAELAPSSTQPTVRPTGERIMLFAPLAPGPLAEFYPESRLNMPYDLAVRIDLLMQGYDGRVGETLPESFAPRWDEGRVPATAGAYSVVETRIVELTRIKGQQGTPPIPDRVEAIAEVRVRDVDGKVIYYKRAIGSTPATTSPKLAAAASIPESRAAWDALDAGLANVRTFISAQNELRSNPTSISEMEPAISLVQVEFEVAPEGAEITIDGVFRGHAPLTLKLPERAMTITITLTGHHPWEREVTPVAGMKIQPVLVSLAPAPAPAPVEMAPTPVEAAPAPAAPAPAPVAPDQEPAEG